MARERAIAAVVAILAMVVVGAAGRLIETRGGVAPAPCAAPASSGAAGVVLRCDGVGDAPRSRAWLVGQKLDVNAARAADFARVPGVGPALAERIVAARAARGSFASLDAIAEVPGVGPRTLEALAASTEVRLSSP